jgi:hypothetical protein
LPTAYEYIIIDIGGYVLLSPWTMLRILK